MTFRDRFDREVELEHIFEAVWGGTIAENNLLVLGQRMYFYDITTGQCLGGPTHPMGFHHSNLVGYTGKAVDPLYGLEDGYGGIS